MAAGNAWVRAEKGEIRSTHLSHKSSLADLWGVHVRAFVTLPSVSIRNPLPSRLVTL